MNRVNITHNKIYREEEEIKTFSDMKIVFRIKEIRINQNKTLKKLSKLSGVSVTHINDIENNNKMPSLINIILIAKGLNIDYKEIYKLFKVYW